MYRAKPVTQQDGSPHANSNCRLASAATGLDFDTLGKKTSTGKEMRRRSGDPSGGTTASDAVRAWATYSETLSTQNGKPWGDVIASLNAGRLVHLDVWAARAGGPCCKSAVGHTIAVAPEQNGEGKWLTMDPWCKPPKWVWWPEAKLKAGAEEWADRCGWRSKTLGYDRDVRKVSKAVLERIVRELMTMWTPDHPLKPENDDYEPETFGVMPTLWTRTDAHPDAAPEGTDMSINTNGSNLEPTRRVKMTAEAGFYADADLTEKYGTLSKGSERKFIGPVVGSKASAILVNTSKPYDDGTDRPTIVYVDETKHGDSYQVPAPPPDNAARDKEWRDWLSKDADAPDKEV
jgi:hypothetical protein